MKLKPKTVFGIVFSLIGIGLFILFSGQISFQMPDTSKGIEALFGILFLLGISVIFIALFQGALFKKS